MDGLVESLTGLLIPPATFVMICFVVHTIVKGLRGWHLQRVTGQFQSKLLDKIGSVTEWFERSAYEERAIVAFMFRVASLPIPDVESRLAATDALWCKAQLLQRWEAERRARRPLDVMQPIEIAGGVVAAGLLLYWSLPYLL